MRWALLWTFFVAPAAAEPLVLRPVPLMDHAGFEQPMAAATLMAPDGWQGTGGISWRFDPCLQTLYGVALDLRSPDGLRAFQVLDLLPWKQNLGTFITEPTTPPGPLQCHEQSWPDLPSYIGSLLPQMAPSARILDRRQRPDIAQALEQQSAPVVALMKQNQLQGSQVSFSYDGLEYLIAANTPQGEMRIDLVCGLSQMTQVTQMPGLPGGGLIPDMPGATFELRIGYPQCVLSSAPNGQLDIRLTEVIRKSLVMSPEWQRRVSEVQNKADVDRRISMSKQAAIRAEANEYSSRMMAEINAMREQSTDRNQREFLEAIKGVETYHDPLNGGTVELDSTYRQAWQLPDGGFVLSDDPNFDASRQVDVNATRLTPVQ